MRLTTRLPLVFGGLLVIAMGSLGTFLRFALERRETVRFGHEVARACEHVQSEVVRDAQRDSALIDNSCKAGELVDRVSVEIERGALAQHRTRFALLVPDTRRAYGFDELLLATGDGDVIGADPRELAQLTPSLIRALLQPRAQGFTLRTSAPLATVVGCAKGEGHTQVGMIGTRFIDATARRLEKELGVGVRLHEAAMQTPPAATFSALCAIDDGAGHRIDVAVDRSREDLDDAIADLDRVVLVATLASVGLALLLSFVLSRSLARPLAQLAIEARKVKSGDAKPLRVQGSGEVRELVIAFDTMLRDLAETRTRLAAATRLAAWREVAKRVAHEVKNPLAPIRAAVETLRRLRARQDPAFDEYFDEATRTVLDEVHRITTIVTEFTSFARLPPPVPKPMDLREVAQRVASSHEHTHDKVRVVAEAGAPLEIQADRDQVIQVLTNLVQNACDSTRAAGGGVVTLALARADGTAKVLVRDEGAGLAEGFEARLFEPYATTKETGTGLGLAISQRIAHEHGGDLRYLGANAGKGAVFELSLPERFGGPLL